ncbi:hypothetical protein CVU37_06490 [candidate division BRC1 bacterium HGW-BRC1-1]|jgi:lysophospholipase L1-like esterase|nr:MAG: hypothetical protein CVU37_06490 [candidate division BRC1 bacterium HGW-BRC1-1]
MSNETTLDGPSQPEPVVIEWNAMAHYHNRLDQIEADVDAALQDGRPRLVLLGDSISEGHPAKEIAGFRVVNMGISGDKIAMEPDGGVLRRLDVVARAKPAHVFLMVGVNDFWHTPPKPVADAKADYSKLAEALANALPDSKLWMLSTFPTAGNHADFNPLVKELNERVRAQAELHGTEYVDLHPVLADPKGELRTEFTSDGIHLTPQGYDAWTSEMERLLNG